MKFGLAFHTTDVAMSPVDLAREAEARGFDSLYFPEHTHIPVSRRTAPPAGEAELPDMYRRTYDPYIALAAAASITKTLRLGTGVALPAQHDAISLAKTIATLDLVSGGRFTWGIGFGWNREEAENHGVAFAERRDIVREKVQAARALWGAEVASYQGEHVRFEPSWQWPKPVQRPGPPVLIGSGAGPRPVRRHRRLRGRLDAHRRRGRPQRVARTRAPWKRGAIRRRSPSCPSVFFRTRPKVD
jgi:probable F420-dependent oxidoreductase